MRVVQSEQMTVGEVDISKITFNPKSRDGIPKILKGLQFVYTNSALRSAIFELLQNKVAPKVAVKESGPKWGQTKRVEPARKYGPQHTFGGQQ